MLRARRLIGEQVRRSGKESIFDLSGMNRGSAINPDDLPHLTSHVPFFEHFEGKTEPAALKYMGADPGEHAALILNRVSAANFIALTSLLTKQDRVFAFAPAGGASHPSTVRPISMLGAAFTEFHTYAELERAWHQGGAPRLLLITPISASKHHIPFDEFRRALALPRLQSTIAYVDDAHMASRIAFFDESPTFQVGPVDLAVCSADKHIAGPRAGVLVGRKDLIGTIGSRAYEFGFEAQAAQYVGVANALRNFDPRPVREAGELAEATHHAPVATIRRQARIPRRSRRVDVRRRRAGDRPRAPARQANDARSGRGGGLGRDAHAGARRHPHDRCRVDAWQFTRGPTDDVSGWRSARKQRDCRRARTGDRIIERSRRGPGRRAATACRGVGVPRSLHASRTTAAAVVASVNMNRRNI